MTAKEQGLPEALKPLLAVVSLMSEHQKQSGECVYGINGTRLTFRDLSNIALAAIAAMEGQEGMVMVQLPPANCRQRLALDAKPYPRSSCSVCGKFSPDSQRCSAILAGVLAAAPAQPDGVGK